MKETITILSMVLLTINTFAQMPHWSWAKSAGGASWDLGYSVSTDASGNVYMTGRFNISTITFGTTTLTNAGDYDIFIVKYDAAGNVLWAKSAGGTSSDVGTCVSTDASGNVLMTGSFQSPAITFGTTTLTSVGYGDIFIVKFDATGNILWAKSAGGIESDLSISISTDANGNVFMTGGFFSPTINFGTTTLTNANNSGNYYDIFIAKYDVTGNVVWAKSAGGISYDEGVNVSTDASGNAYMTGYFQSSNITFGTTTLTNANYQNIFIVKYDASGNVLWAKSAGGTSYDYSNSVSTNASDNVYMTGCFFSPTITFGTTTLTNAGDYDIFIVKYDATGNVLWAKSAGGVYGDIGKSVSSDASGNVYMTGSFSSPTITFGTTTLTNTSPDFPDSSDIFIIKYDASGNVLWAKSAGGASSDEGLSMSADASGDVYITGYFNSNTITFGTTTLTNANNTGDTYDIFIAKLKQANIYGSVFNDISNDCVNDSNETGLSRRNLLINPGNMIMQTYSDGTWTLDSLPAGNYSITADTSGSWKRTCPLSQNFTVIAPDSVTSAPSFGFISTETCPQPNVSINMPFIRRCFNNQNVYVNACNENIATGTLNNAYILVQLDSLLSVQSSTLSYLDLGDNTFRFDIGNLNPGQCQNFSIACSLSCNALLGQTLCMSANLFPADSCVFDTIPDIPTGVSLCTLPWDKSSLKVEASCISDTTGDKAVRFVIYNIGEPGDGDMKCHSPVRLYVDGVLTKVDSVKLNGGDSTIFVYSGDGRTYRLETDQHPLHPGNSHPNASIELCGGTMNWQPGLITALPEDDADPIVDIYCGAVRGSYDPNDKAGYPTGVDSTNNLYPNQALEYLIRFQNTGTDTAFTVVIRDTLDTDLDIFTVQSGASSHTYTFRLYGQRILEWTFNNILLPDSNKNEPGSHGFVSFRAEQNKNLPNNTLIKNTAGIYFDFNDPVLTNVTVHTVNDGVKKISTGTKVNPVPKSKNNVVKIYPNPFHSSTVIKINGLLGGYSKTIDCKIYNLLGKEVTTLCKLGRKGDEYIIERGGLKSGVYFYRVSGTNINSANGMMVVE